MPLRQLSELIAEDQTTKVRMNIILPILSIAYAIGIVFFVWSGLSFFSIMMWCVLCVVGAFFFFKRFFTALILLGFVACGSLGMAVVVNKAKSQCHVSNWTSNNKVQIIARVLGFPVPTEYGERQLLEAVWLIEKDQNKPLCGSIEIRRSKGGAAVWPGETILFSARLKPALGPRNPKVSGPQLRFISNNVGAIAYVENQDVLIVDPRGPSWLASFRNRLREILAQNIQNDSARRILAAIVLGDGFEIDVKMRQRFSRAGVSHLLAVSGLHLSIIIAFVFLGLRKLLRCFTALSKRTDPSWIAALLAICASILYMLLTGAAPATVRACVMVCACLFGFVISRAPDLIRPLSLAALVLLVCDPLNLFRPGFQLSFAAVIGISLFLKKFPVNSLSKTESKWRRLWNWILALLLTSVAATAMTAPLVAQHFQEVSFWGLAINLLAIPLTTFVILPLGLLGVVCGAVGFAFSKYVLCCASLGAQLLDALCAVVSDWDIFVIHFIPNWTITFGFLVLPFALVRKIRIFAISISSLLISIGVLPGLIFGGNVMNVTFLDIGHGDSAFIEFPDGKTMLVDGGGSMSGDYDPGTNRVVPFLKKNGVKKIDFVIASHPHADHVGGLVAVLKEVRVKELWTCWNDKPNEWQEKLLHAASEYGVKVFTPREIRIGQVLVQPIWPRSDKIFCADPLNSTNNSSIVLRLEFEKSTLLFTGDIERETEIDLVSSRNDDLKASVLKVPHHGSYTSSSLQWIKTVSPKLAVVSCGPQSQFGFPDPRVLQRYESLGIETARIDKTGAVLVKLYRDGSFEWSAPYSPYW